MNTILELFFAMITQTSSISVQGWGGGPGVCSDELRQGQMTNNKSLDGYWFNGVLVGCELKVERRMALIELCDWQGIYDPLPECA
ncbi:hypothetical protein B0T22DRAFT_168414 [Podospora appendiculata]|uniref:Sushi domain-containing protein n=1 Tax=Podospora appendiculata TaxID=314037 RepID=A0AAE0XAU4_9PEZI|nr:hypothetical protein B0T22DRAFT_168414 [Podospora appendiculata]